MPPRKRAAATPPDRPRTNQYLYSSQPRESICPGCRRPVLRALVDGVRVRCDPWPLELADIARAFTVGRRVFVRMAFTLVWIDSDRVGMMARYPVVAAHWCGGIFRASGRPTETIALPTGVPGLPY